MVQKVALGQEIEAGFAVRQLEHSLSQPSSKCIPFYELGKEERDGLRLSFAVPKMQWDSNPYCPYGLLGYWKPFLLF